MFFTFVNKRIMAGAIKDHIIYSCLTCCLLLISCDNNNPDKQRGKNVNSNTVTQNIQAAPPKSFAEMEKQLETDSQNIDLRIQLASAYYSAGKYENAIHHLLIVNGVDSTNQAVLISLGNLYYDTEQNENAIEFYGKVLSVDSLNYNARCDMATCYLRLGMTEKTINILNKNIQMNPYHAQSYYNLSIAFRQAGRIEESEEFMRKYKEVVSLQNMN